MVRSHLPLVLSLRGQEGRRTPRHLTQQWRESGLTEGPEGLCPRLGAAAPPFTRTPEQSRPSFPSAREQRPPAHAEGPVVWISADTVRDAAREPIPSFGDQRFPHARIPSMAHPLLTLSGKARTATCPPATTPPAPKRVQVSFPMLFPLPLFVERPQPGSSHHRHRLPFALSGR